MKYKILSLKARYGMFGMWRYNDYNKLSKNVNDKIK